MEERYYTMDSVLEFKYKGGVERKTLSEIYNEDVHGTEEEFYDFISSWIQTGRAKLIENKTKDEEIADMIAKEIMTVQKSKQIEEDRTQRTYCNQSANGYYNKVGFPAKTLIDAQEMHQQLIKNFNIKQAQLGVEMQGDKILVIINDCPVKTYASIERAFGFKRATEAVSGVVDRTAKSAVNLTDMTLNNVAVPVAKTVVGTTTKVAKSLFGFTAKLAGIAVGEVTKATKQCVEEIKNDGYIAEAKGEVIDGVHCIKRAVNNSSFGNNGGGIIMN